MAIAFVAGGLSAFLVNDTVCLMLTPLVLAVVADAELPPLPYLLALCMASNPARWRPSPATRRT